MTKPDLSHQSWTAYSMEDRAEPGLHPAAKRPPTDERSHPLETALMALAP